MKKKLNIKRVALLLILLVILVISGIYLYYQKSINYSNSNEITINVESGMTYSSLGSILKSNDLIKNELVYKIYIKLNSPTGLENGSYTFKSNCNLNCIIETIKKGATNNNKTITVTFIEGKNMRYIVSVINKNFGFTEKEVLNKINDDDYLDSLINKYWFLTDKIKSKKIYYSLEGYLYPDTYEFYTNASIENIFETMLNNMEKKLSSYKDSINGSKYSIHEMLTLASIIELEAGTSKDRKGVSGVFYNRLNSGWSLGSDVTTYYAEKIDNWSRDLKLSELNDCNDYNTRSNCMYGKLPVSPICNPGMASIEAAINPTKHKYYYFVADKNGKTYFNETDSGHNSTVSKLKRDGLWIEYEN